MDNNVQVKELADGYRITAIGPSGTRIFRLDPFQNGKHVLYREDLEPTSRDHRLIETNDPDFWIADNLEKFIGSVQ